MKKLFIAILTILSFIFGVGCAQKTYELPWDQFCSKGMEVIELELEDKKYIIKLLNESKWENDLAKCDCDFAFHPQRQRVEYHSECGTFNDVTSGKSTKVTEEQRLKINGFLGAL